MKSSRINIGNLVLQIALALFFVAAGVVTVQLDGGLISQAKALIGKNEISSAVYSLFGRGDFSGVLIVIIGILEIAGGAFLLIKLFANTGNIADILMMIIMIMWIVVIILVDIAGTGGAAKGAFKNTGSFIAFMKSFSLHLIVLGAILSVSGK